MIIADLVIFNREVLQRLKEVGVKLDDYKYCDLYRDYLELSETTGSRKEVMLTLADRYKITDRQVYNIINRLKTPIS